MKISLLPPTRNRPFNMLRMVASAYETAAEPENVEIVFYVDDDDEASIDFFESSIKDDYDGTKMFKGPRQYLSKCHNDAYTICTGEIVSFIGDDVVFNTYGWDQKVKEAFTKHPDNILFVYPEDGINGVRLGAHGFIHRRWVETVGYVVPPYFSARFADTWVNEVARNIDRACFLPDVYIEHMHYVVNKGPVDETMRQNNERDANDNMGLVWYNTLSKRIEDAVKLGKVIGKEIKDYQRIL